MCDETLEAWVGGSPTACRVHALASLRKSPQQAGGEEGTVPDRSESTVGLVTQNTPFRLLEVEALYQVVDPACIEHVYTRRDRVSPQHPARFYERRYRWTGTETRTSVPKLSSSTDGIPHKVHGPLVRDDDDIAYIVDLGARVARGRKIWIETRQVLLDEGRTFRPYLRHRVSQETQRLRLAVTLPDNLANSMRPFYADGSAKARLDLPRRVKTAYLEAQNTFILEVSKPRIGYIYGIEWL